MVTRVPPRDVVGLACPAQVRHGLGRHDERQLFQPCSRVDTVHLGLRLCVKADASHHPLEAGHSAWQHEGMMFGVFGDEVQRPLEVFDRVSLFIARMTFSARHPAPNNLLLDVSSDFRVLLDLLAMLSSGCR